MVGLYVGAVAPSMMRLTMCRWSVIVSKCRASQLQSTNLTIQYFIVYTARAFVQTATDVWALGYQKVPVQKFFQTAALTVNYAPRLADLSLAVSVRVT